MTPYDQWNAYVQNVRCTRRSLHKYYSSLPFLLQYFELAYDLFSLETFCGFPLACCWCYLQGLATKQPQTPSLPPTTPSTNSNAWNGSVYNTTTTLNHPTTNNSHSIPPTTSSPTLSTQIGGACPKGSCYDDLNCPPKSRLCCEFGSCVPLCPILDCWEPCPDSKYQLMERTGAYIGCPTCVCSPGVGRLLLAGIRKEQKISNI